MTVTTAISLRAKTSIQLIKLKELPDAMSDLARGDAPCKPAGIAYALRPINGPASHPTRSKTPRLGGDSTPAYDPASRIYLPAAQVQDRRHCRHARSRRGECTTSVCGCTQWRGRAGFEVIVGGGLGRTPFIGKTIKPFLHKRDLLSYVEAILRVYNQYGRRDNIYKARIKILVHELGAEAFAREVEAEWQSFKDGALALDPSVIANVAASFLYPDYELLEDNPQEFARLRKSDRHFDTWVANAVSNHKKPGYAIVTLSLKPEGGPPGDATAEQMDAIADLAEQYSFGEIRVGHEQNLVFPHVTQRDLPALWRALDKIGVATPNVGLVSDIIACPGLDYCSLANTRSIPVAQELTRRFCDLDLARDLGRLHVNSSGCINACGHHHVGDIGLLGVEKNGEEFFQITIGGRADEGGIGCATRPSRALFGSGGRVEIRRGLFGVARAAG
jgi:sulfite reductase beta subunit-like hemoprotein